MYSVPVEDVSLFSLLRKRQCQNFRNLDTFPFSSSESPSPPLATLTDCGELPAQLQLLLFVSQRHVFIGGGGVGGAVGPPATTVPLHLCGPVGCQLEPLQTSGAPAASDAQHAAKNGQREADRRPPGSRRAQLPAMQGRNRGSALRLGSCDLPQEVGGGRGGLGRGRAGRLSGRASV